MRLQLNLDHILKPFKDSVKQTIALPQDIALSSFQELLAHFFNHESLSLQGHPVHTHNHIPAHIPTFYIKAAPLESGFYLAITPPAYTKILEHFYGSSTEFSDERLTKGAFGYLVANFINSLNEKKLFSTLSFYLAEQTQTQETLQSVKLEILLENTLPLVCEMYFPESFVDAYMKHFSSCFIDKIHDICFTSSIVIGHVQLSKEKFLSCQLHDAILLDEILYMPLEQKGLAKLAYQGAYFAQVRMHHNTLKFLDFNPLPEEVTMEQQSESPLKALSDVTLEFQIEFARLNLNFSEFERLTSGQTLELTKDNPTSCYLTLQGQRVAKGELVKVGEQMAFLIEELKS